MAQISISWRWSEYEKRIIPRTDSKVNKFLNQSYYGDFPLVPEFAREPLNRNRAEHDWSYEPMDWPYWFVYAIVLSRTKISNGIANIPVADFLSDIEPLDHKSPLLSDCEVVHYLNQLEENGRIVRIPPAKEFLDLFEDEGDEISVFVCQPISLLKGEGTDKVMPYKETAGESWDESVVKAV